MPRKEKDSTSPPRLIDELRESQRDLVKTIGPAMLVALAGLLVAFYFVEPPPPKELVIAAGPADGNYYAAAQKYARRFEENGVTLIIRETAGSIENYDLLTNDDSVSLAIVQGGTAPEDLEADQLEAIASLYVEPMWVFFPTERPVRRLTELQGKRIAMGEQESGTQMLAKMMLAVNGVNKDESQFVTDDASHVAERLRNGELDAAFFVRSAESPVIQDLIKDQSIGLLSFERSGAYAQKYPFLDDVVLLRGMVDLQFDLPSRDVKLVAPVANMVATPDLHDAFIPVLLEAAMDVHGYQDLVTGSEEHPSLSGAEFTINPVARHYLKFGPSFLQKFLGFWISSLIDRTKIVMLPLVVLIIPLIKLAPPVYRWRIRSRIYRWYALIREIDKEMIGSDEHQLVGFEKKLSGVEKELGQVTVPLSYMEEFYHMRLHIDLVKRRLKERLENKQATEWMDKPINQIQT